MQKYATKTTFSICIGLIVWFTQNMRGHFYRYFCHFYWKWPIHMCIYIPPSSHACIGLSQLSHPVGGCFQPAANFNLWTVSVYTPGSFYLENLKVVGWEEIQLMACVRGGCLLIQIQGRHPRDDTLRAKWEPHKVRPLPAPCSEEAAMAFRKACRYCLRSIAISATASRNAPLDTVKTYLPTVYLHLLCTHTTE